MILLLFLIIFVASEVAALGIRPAKTTIISEEIKELESTVWVVNDEARDFTVHISVEGEMASYVKFEPEELTLRADDDAKPIYLKVKLPASVPPGISTANIVVEEVIPNRLPGSISAKIVLKHKIVIEGPYPDKYVKTKLNFREQGQEIALISEVENVGRLNIDKIQTTFYVNDRQQNVHTAETEQTSLARNENKLLKATLERDVFELGEFDLSAITTYDDQKIEIVQKLVVGKPEVDVTYFDRYFIANKINQYSLDLQNKWNKPIPNVYVDVEVKKDNQKIDEFRTRSVDLDAEMSQRITDYLDARDKGPGTYTFDLMVNFWNTLRMDQQQFQFESELVSEEEANSIDRTPPVLGQAGRTAGSGGSAASGIWLWIIVGVLIGGLGVLVVYRYIHKNEYE